MSDTTTTPPAETAPAPRKPRRNRKVIITAAAALVLAVALTLAGLKLTAGPGTFTAHGSETVAIDAPDVADGSQVTVTDSAGHVIGTGTLATDDSKAAQQAISEHDAVSAALSMLDGGGTSMSVYKFTVTGLPAGQARYGVSAGKDRGTVWFSEKQMRAGPGISLGD